MSSGINSELTKLRIDRSKKRRRGGGKWIWIVLLLAAGGGGGYYAYSVKFAPVPVKVVKAERVEASAAAPKAAGSAVLTVNGYVIPRMVIEVSSKIIGRVKENNVVRGKAVKAGEVLIRLEDTEQQAQVQMAEARANSTRARLAELKAGSRPQEVQASRAAVASSQATLDNAGSELKRLESLVADKIISAQEFERAQAAERVAAANLKSAQEQLKLVEQGPRQEQIDSMQAQLGEDEANLDYARTQLAETIIKAPVDGIILEKVAEEGELVTNMNFGGDRGAKSSVVSMADLKDLQVELDINESDVPKIFLGQTAEIRVDSAPDKTFRGEIDEIAPQADRQKGTVEAKVRLIGPTSDVLPEVNARVTFLSPQAKPDAAQTAEGPAPKARVFAPKAAIKGSGDTAQVFIASDGEAIARTIKLGAETERGVEVLEGLGGTESLIVEPLDKIQNGTRIQEAAS